MEISTDTIERPDDWAGRFALNPNDLWTRGNVGEVVPNPVTPLTMTFYQKTGMVLVYPELETLWELLRLPPMSVMRLIRGRVYFNLGGLAWLQTEGLGLPSWLARIRIRAMGGTQDVVPAGKRFRPWKLVRSLPAIAKTVRAAGAGNWSIAAFEHALPTIREQIAAAQLLDLARLSDADLWAHVERLAGQMQQAFTYHYLGGLAIALFGVLELLLTRWLGDEGHALANDLVSGVSGTKDQEVASVLWQVTQVAKQEPAAQAILGGDPAQICPRLLVCAAAPRSAAALRQFFAAFGHRGADEWELLAPRWREEPALVGTMLSAYAKAPAEAAPDARVAAQTLRRAQAERALHTRLGRLKAAIIMRLATRTRRFMPMRENPKHFWLALFAEERRAMLEAGRRLAVRGALSDAEDIFFLTLDEVQQALLTTNLDRATLRQRADRRREQHQADLALPPLDVVHADEVAALECGLTPVDAPPHRRTGELGERPAGQMILKGMPVSRGLVTGRARIVLRPEEGHSLQPGDILVAPFTDPAWTPLFAVVSAIVMDLGGALSHGSILAREYGIPAVVNVPHATTTLRDGQLITVDGGRGIVTIGDRITEQTGDGATERRGDKQRRARLPARPLAGSPAHLLHAPLVLPLDSAAATLDLTGGKGASLARLAAAGLPVPPGFHVTTAAYWRFVVANGLQGTILATLADIEPRDVGALEQAAAAIRARFAEGTTPEPIAQAVRQAYRVLGAGDTAVAVRSSATAEDLPGLSFAGQQESYLNVRGEEAVLEAVKRCWASLWTPRAIAYRARHGILPEHISLAVVVQELVLAEAAGVLFTVNPLTGAFDQAVINATWGLGQAIVGGLVTPDALVVEKQTGAIVAQEIATKAVMTVRTAGGTREEPVPTARRTQPALAARQVAALVRIGARIEQLYGQPMDIEWAIQEGELFVVQARPITALPEHVVAGHPPTK